MTNHIVIIGAGQAACSCAAKLRQEDKDAKITLIGEERSLPYQRPPLSKGYSKGTATANSLLLRSADWFQEHKVTCKSGSQVQSVDPKRKTVHFGDGETITYDKAVLATGSRPRTLAASVGGDLAGVHVLRDLGDADALRSKIATAKKVLIVGGGYIGLEAASVFRELGLEVCLVEAAPRILKRVASKATSDYFRDLHERNGVRLIEGVSLVRLCGDQDKHFVGAELSDGSEVRADFALIGIGGIANDELAVSAGLACDNGIVVDARGKTSDPSIFACGDCTALPFEGTRIRLESVQNAIDQGEAVASEIVGEGSDYAPVPWFWSDQYDVKLQIAGFSQGFDRIVERPGKRPNSCSIWYYRNSKLIAVDAMNEPQAYMIGRKLLTAGVSPTVGEIADTSTSLVELTKTGKPV